MKSAIFIIVTTKRRDDVTLLPRYDDLARIEEKAWLFPGTVL